MNRHPAALLAGQFDALIVGGGILGAGIARDATLRGLRVALIDKGDFASGTSSASSKLIHGGIRYLEHCNFRLVAEASRERAILQRIAPHLVRPLPLLFPVYQNDRRSLLTIRAGATFYDWIAGARKIATHESFSAMQARQKEPALAEAGLRGAVLIHDCQEDDARFCLDNILHAAELGAVCVNYCELTGFVTRQNHIVAARLADGSEVTARTFINATGPWAEHVAKLAGDESVTLSPTKGIHLLLPKLTQQHALIFQAKRDGRILFILPWGECSIVGTTDTDWRGDPGTACAQDDDIKYLLDEIRQLLPESRPEIITTFAGVRALLKSDAQPGHRSREHRIVRRGNLIHVLGGKYTTYRLIAKQVVDQLSDERCRTADTPLPAHRPPPTGEQVAGNVFASDISHACDHEMALTVSDVMRRRTGLALSANGGVEVASKVARLMAAHTGRNMDASLQEYLHDRDRPSRV